MNSPVTENIRVLVVASDPLARAGLIGLLTDDGSVSVAGAVGEESDLTAALDAYQASVVLWDTGPRADTDFTDNLQYVDVPVVALIPDETSIRQVIGTRARGVLLRNADAEMITRALAAVQSELVVVDPALAESALALPETLPEVEMLTPREEEVLQLLAEGLPNKLIADRLDISENTVKFHVSSVLGKLGAQSRTEAVMHAARRGLLVL